MSSTTARTRQAVKAAGLDTQATLYARTTKEKWKGRLFLALIMFSALVGVAMLFTLIIDAFVDGLPRLDRELFTQAPSGVPERAGFRTSIFGSIWLMIGVVLVVVPLGVGAAVYLEEYADGNRWWNQLIEINIQNLAAVPSIVFGILGLGFIVRGPIGIGPIVLAGSITLALMVLPTVILASREAIRSVPNSIRQGSMALGATQWQTIRYQVLPASVPGIATGVILALSRAIGETAPLLLVGAFVFTTTNPTSLLDDGYTALPVQIFSWVTRPQDEFRVLAAAGIILLLGLLLSMNSVAIWLRNRFAHQW